MTGSPPRAGPGADASSATALALAWLVVLVPLAWGVEQVVGRSLALFGG